MVRRPVLLLLAATAAHAQLNDAALDRYRASKQQVMDQIRSRARQLTDRAIEDFRTTADWEQQRDRRTEEMRDMLGLLPWPRRTSLNVRKTGIVDGGDYTVEKLAFESLPQFFVTGNLFVPKQRSGRLPAIVYVCGHAYSEHGAKTAYQRHGITFARNGYVALILDPIQIAELYAPHHGLYNQEFYDWYSRGYTPAGVEVWNAIRAIDYLESRPEVDASRIGMTGRSGGAAMTIFTASVEPRIKAAVAGMGSNTYAATIGAANAMHCDCMFTINSHQHDMLHQSALIAPRPLQLTHGRLDLSFPEEGYREVEQRIGDLYRAYGHPERFQNLVLDHGHQDSDFQREQAVLWFNRFLKNDTVSKVRMDFVNHPAEALSVFQGRPPADALNHRVHETFTTRPPSGRYPGRGAWETRRSELLRLLRDKVFGAMPRNAATPAALEPGEHQTELDAGVSVRYLLDLPKQAGKYPALVYIASDGEDPRAIRMFLDSARARPGQARLIVYPRGVGEAPWEKSFWKDVLRNAMHVGHTVDSMRLYDVMRAIGALRQTAGVDGSKITVMGSGVAGVLGLYAAILEPDLAQVILSNPPDTHASGPIFLNILRYTDLPEAAALLAPRRLNFYGRMPPAFDYTRHVYELYGKPDYLFRAASLDAVLEGRYHHGFAAGY
jgi:cephalosporin-C deacetylase-like acetyl esterase